MTLRPGWPEDAPALARAIAHEPVARMLTHVPFPYGEADAATFLARPCTASEPRFLIFAHDRDATPLLVGGIGITPYETGPELGYWLTPDAWGRGYATEAGRAVVAMARDALPLTRLSAWHFVDNPASGRVLRKLGFQPTGRTLVKRSGARASDAASIEYALDLSDDAHHPMPIAA
ncbi:GNAT family N-acetyltransferase [Sphingomonas sp. FARSPH]|nr:GNAT family N-acetyltransferase [Sphingomonas sp. FARSPH]